MSFKSAPAAPGRKKIGTGISISLRELKGGRQKVRITFSTKIQTLIFGGPMAGRRFDVQVGRGTDEGKLRIVEIGDGEVVENGEFTARPGVKGSASLFVGSWDLLPKGKRTAAPCEVAFSPRAGECILKLPAWCRPSGVGGRMEEQHGLKRAGAARG